jgi:hypothetical protein
MRLRLPLFIVCAVLLAVPAAFACQDCPDGVQCIFATEGYSGCFETIDTGCHVSGNCGVAAPALASQWQIAAVRVMPNDKAPALAPRPAQPVVAAAAPAARRTEGL